LVKLRDGNFYTAQERELNIEPPYLTAVKHELTEEGYRTHTHEARKVLAERVILTATNES